MPWLLLLLLFFCVTDATDFSSRSPENCYCETWSVGNALGALGGIDGDYDVAPGRTYSGGRSQTSSGSSCVPWLQVGGNSSLFSSTHLSVALRRADPPPPHTPHNTVIVLPYQHKPNPPPTHSTRWGFMAVLQCKRFTKMMSSIAGREERETLLPDAPEVPTSHERRKLVRLETLLGRPIHFHSATLGSESPGE